MKIVIIFSLLLVSLSSICQNYTQKEIDSITNAYWKEREKSNKELINKPFPPFSCINKGDTVDNNHLKGKIVFINFWFEACAPCIAEFDALNELYGKLKNNDRFEFISFTYESENDVEKLKIKYNIPYRVLSIKREDCYRLNNNNGFPTSMIIDTLGLIKYRTSGGSIDKNVAKEFIMSNIYPEITKRL